jgi:PhzF family phenazine biosynthesis protein
VRARIYQLDAFTTELFAGNPAAVVVLQSFPDDRVLQSIAAENNLPETAFIVRDGTDYLLRWCTPVIEVPFCGHATLASAAVVMSTLERERSEVIFHTRSGPLIVSRSGTAYSMDFPARQLQPLAIPSNLAAVLGAAPLELYSDGSNNYLALLDGPRRVRTLAPDLSAIAKMDCSGVIVSARGDEGYDFISRYFAPAKGIPEDPVTGGAHCALTPFWAQRLGRSELRAYQASARGGAMHCRLAGERVVLKGDCVFYLEGEIEF